MMKMDTTGQRLLRGNKAVASKHPKASFTYRVSIAPNAIQRGPLPAHFCRLFRPELEERPIEPDLRPDAAGDPLLRTLGVLRGCCLTLGVFRGCWRTLGAFRGCFRISWPDCLARVGVLRGFCLAIWLKGGLTLTKSSLLRPEPARTFVACRSRFGFLLEVDTCLPRSGLRFGEFDPAKRGFLMRSGCRLNSRRS